MVTGVSYHCTGQVAHRSDAACVHVPALPSHTPEIVSVKNHADHSVLELLGDDVVEDYIQHCAEVHQESCDDGPRVENTMFFIPNQAKHQENVERHETHQNLSDQCEDDTDGLLLHFGFEFRGASMDKVVHNNYVAADHQKYGNQEKEDEAHKVDAIVVPHKHDVLHLNAGGKVGHTIGVFIKKEYGKSGAQRHDPHSHTSHHGFGDVPQLFAVLGLDDGHVAVCTDHSKQPQSHTWVEDGESGIDSTENVPERPVVHVVVDHPEGKQQDEGEVHHRHVDHIHSDRVSLLGGKCKYPESSDIDHNSNGEDKAVEDQASHVVLRWTLLWSFSHVGDVYRHSETYKTQQETRFGVKQKKKAEPSNSLRRGTNYLHRCEALEYVAKLSSMATASMKPNHLFTNVLG